MRALVHTWSFGLYSGWPTHELGALLAVTVVWGILAVAFIATRADDKS